FCENKGKRKAMSSPKRWIVSRIMTYPLTYFLTSGTDNTGSNKRDGYRLFIPTLTVVPERTEISDKIAPNRLNPVIIPMIYIYMWLLGKHQQIEGLVGFYQGIHHLHGVGKRSTCVTGSVDNQQLAPQSIGDRDIRAVVVALFVIRRHAHIRLLGDHGKLTKVAGR